MSTACAQERRGRRNSLSRPFGSKNPELTVTDQVAHFHVGRSSLQNICTDVADEPTRDQHNSSPATGVSCKFPSRPSCDVLSDSIPLFFIARNRVGFWIARDAEGRAGGIFLFRKSALRFAKKGRGISGCATMLLADRLELDVESRGNRVIAWISAALDVVTLFLTDYPHPIPMLEKRRKGEWLCQKSSK
jgi:hypothetical protein